MLLVCVAVSAPIFAVMVGLAIFRASRSTHLIWSEPRGSGSTWTGSRVHFRRRTSSHSTIRTPSGARWHGPNQSTRWTDTRLKVPPSIFFIPHQSSAPWPPSVPCSNAILVDGLIKKRRLCRPPERVLACGRSCDYRVLRTEPARSRHSDRAARKGFRPPPPPKNSGTSSLH